MGRKIIVRTVLGLSLDSDVVAWVLLNAADGTVLDHDAVDSHGDSELAGAVARSAHVIARASGFEVDRVRLTWTGAASGEGLRLRNRLECLGFGDVEAVPMASVMAVLVDPEATDITPRLALAYGAALAVVDSDAEPEAHPQTGSGRPRHPRKVTVVLGGVAAAGLVLLGLSVGGATSFQTPSMTPEDAVPAQAGWAAVPAPPDAAAALVRKVVTPTTDVGESSTGSTQTFSGARAIPEAVPEAPSTPAAQPHLSSPQHSMGSIPGPPELFTPATDTDLAELAEVFTALP